MKQSYLVATLLALAFISTPSWALDLMQAYDLALANDPTFRSATKEYEAGQASLTIGRSGLLPQLSANYYGATNKSTITQPPYTGAANFTSNQNYQSNNGGFQISQALFNLQALAAYWQGTAQANAAQSKFLFNSQDLLIRVLQGYTDLLNGRDQLMFYTAQRDAYKEQLKVNEARYKAGDGTITDALETRTSYEMAEAQVIDTRDVVENNKRKLEGIIGVTLPSASEIKTLIPNFKVTPLLPKEFNQWQETALNSNAEIITAKHSQEVAYQEYRKNFANALPTVSAVASWNQQNSAYVASINQNAITTSVGIQANWSIFSGGQTLGQATQALANYQKAQADTEVVSTRVITELRKQYDIVMSSSQKIMALGRAVEAATELTKAMRKSILGGERINMDALLADKGLATARRDLALAKYSYTLALLRLKQQAGTLTIDDLEGTASNFQRDGSYIVMRPAPKVTEDPIASPNVTVKSNSGILLPELSNR